MTRQALFAVAMVIAMVGAPLTGAVAADSAGNATGNLSVGVAQDDSGETTVSVTRNGTDVANASVLVEADDTYVGTGDYTADDDGEVELPAPTENVTVNVTAEDDNEMATTTAELDAVEENETFGKRVSTYVLALHNDQSVTKIGPHVAAFVTAQNPGNAPDHAGPPTSVTGDEADGDSNERGAPAHAGPSTDVGPPEDRGDDDEEDAEDEEEDGERGPAEGAGPPDQAGG